MHRQDIVPAAAPEIRIDLGRVEPVLLLLDDEGRDVALAAFAHASEAAPDASALDRLRRFFDLAEARWLAPDDIGAGALGELLRELAARMPCGAGDVAGLIEPLRAFFAFAEREFGYPRAGECLAALAARDEARATPLRHAPGGARAVVSRDPGEPGALPGER